MSLSTLSAVPGNNAPDLPASLRGIPLLLRLESAAALALAAGAYHWLGGSWLLFGLLFLLPDIAMLGYLTGPRRGAWTYNAAHTYLAPAALGLLGITTGQALPLHLAAIWAAHVAFDRMLGYGLKHRSGFHDTHLGRIGG